MTRMFGVQRKMVRALRPVLTRAAGVPMPEDSVFEAIERLHADLEQVQQILTEKDSTVRLVLTPETVVVAEARRSLTTLSLYGYRVDGVIANRVFPAGRGRCLARGLGDVPAGRCSRRSASRSPTCRSGGRGLPRRTSRWAATPWPASPRRRTTAPTRSPYPTGEGPLTITRTSTGAVLRIALPFARTQDVDLARHGDELVVTVGSYRRLLALPAALNRHTVTAARVEDGALQVRFRFEQEEQP